MSLLFSRYLSDGSANPHFYSSLSKQSGLASESAHGSDSQPGGRTCQSVLLAGKLLRSWNSIVWQT